MKQLICTLSIICLFFAINIPLQAQKNIKVLDKSSKKVPVWVNSSATDYIITSAIKNNIEAAKNQCMENIRQQIIRSVAENIKSSSASSIDQLTVNSDMTDFVDKFTSTMESRSADLPFLKGISPNKIEEYYWEKRENKDTKEISYLYSIKYPFSNGELKRIVREFEKRDKEMESKYLILKENFNTISSVEEIDRAISELNAIIDYFFDDNRKNLSRSLQSDYRKLYDNIVFKTLSEELGLYKFCLMLNGRVITTSQRLTLKSDIATQLKADYEEDNIIIHYNYQNSVYNEENYVTVNFRFGGKAVQHKFFFTVRKNDIMIYPEKTVFLTAQEKSDTALINIAVRMNIKSENAIFYIVKNITLEIPGITETLFLDNLDVEISRKEDILNVVWTGNVALSENLNNRSNFLRGTIYIQVPEKSYNKSIDFSLPFKSNW